MVENRTSALGDWADTRQIKKVIKSLHGNLARLRCRGKYSRVATFLHTLSTCKFHFKSLDTIGPSSLAHRLRRICSSEDTFNLRSNPQLTQYLNVRGYNLSFFKQEIRHVHAIQRDTALKPSANSTITSSRVPFVTYNPALRSLPCIKKPSATLSSF